MGCYKMRIERKKRILTALVILVYEVLAESRPKLVDMAKSDCEISYNTVGVFVTLLWCIMNSQLIIAVVVSWEVNT